MYLKGFFLTHHRSLSLYQRCTNFFYPLQLCDQLPLPSIGHSCGLDNQFNVTRIFLNQIHLNSCSLSAPVMPESYLHVSYSTLVSLHKHCFRMSPINKVSLLYHNHFGPSVNLNEFSGIKRFNSLTPVLKKLTCRAITMPGNTQRACE